MQWWMAVALCALHVAAHATEQAWDRLVIGSHVFPWPPPAIPVLTQHTEPLAARCTSQYRGYVATWELRDSEMWLTRIKPCLPGSVPDSAERLALPIRAWWINKVAIVDLETRSPDRVGKRFLLLRVERGRVTDSGVWLNTASWTAADAAERLERFWRPPALLQAQVAEETHQREGDEAGVLAAAARWRHREDTVREVAQCRNRQAVPPSSLETRRVFDPVESVIQQGHARWLWKQYRESIALMEQASAAGSGRASAQLHYMLLGSSQDGLNQPERSRHFRDMAIRQGEWHSTWSTDLTALVLRGVHLVNLAPSVAPAAPVPRMPGRMGGGHGLDPDNAAVMLEADSDLASARVRADWLARNHPGYTLRSRRIAANPFEAASGRILEIVDLVTADCRLLTLHFDITRLFGKG